MAASHPLHIEFFGKSAHASLPQSGVDALAMAVETYNGIMQMKATQMNPFEQYICSVGMLSAGSTDLGGFETIAAAVAVLQAMTMSLQPCLMSHSVLAMLR